jgi:hypothetical protein
LKKGDGYFIEVDRMSPVDLAIKNAEVTISRKRLADTFGDGNCF